MKKSKNNKDNNNKKEEMILTNKKRKREEKEHNEIFKFIKNLAVDSYIHLGTDNIFCVFKALDNIFYLVYSNKSNSIITYNINDGKKLLELKKAHTKFITSLEHTIQKKEDRDLIMSMSAKENNIKIWNFHNFECLAIFENKNNRLYNMGCFLNNIFPPQTEMENRDINIYLQDDHTSTSDKNNEIIDKKDFEKNELDLYIVRTGDINNPISVYDMNQKKIKEINNSKYKINAICVYKRKINIKIIIVIKIMIIMINKYKNETNKNNSNNSNKKYNFNLFNKTYIVAVNDDKIRSYDYYSNDLYNIYTSNIKQRINSICFNEKEKIIKLIAVCYGGYILIWNFDNANLIEQIRPYKTDLFGICLWDNERLCFGHKKNIKIINLNNRNINTVLPGENKDIVSIQKIYIPKYGECLITQGDDNSHIKLWIKQK